MVATKSRVIFFLALSGWAEYHFCSRSFPCRLNSSMNCICQNMFENIRIYKHNMEIKVITIFERFGGLQTKCERKWEEKSEKQKEKLSLHDCCGRDVEEAMADNGRSTNVTFTLLPDGTNFQIRFTNFYRLWPLGHAQCTSSHRACFDGLDRWYNFNFFPTDSAWLKWPSMTHLAGRL